MSCDDTHSVRTYSHQAINLYQNLYFPCIWACRCYIMLSIKAHIFLILAELSVRILKYQYFLLMLKENQYINGEKESLKLNRLHEQEEVVHSSFIVFLSPLILTEFYDHEIFSWCGKVEILSTPEHTDGHISLYLYEFKTLIAGDASFVQDGELSMDPEIFHSRFRAGKKSVKKLLDYNIEKVICYHGSCP